MAKKRMKLDADEKMLLASVERGEWKSVGGGKRERARYAQYARATVRKDRGQNIRLSSKDLEAMAAERITPRLLNMRQAATYLGCSFWTARDYVLQGLIPVVDMPPLRAREPYAVGGGSPAMPVGSPPNPGNSRRDGGRTGTASTDPTVNQVRKEGATESLADDAVVVIHQRRPLRILLALEPFVELNEIR